MLILYYALPLMLATVWVWRFDALARIMHSRIAVVASFNVILACGVDFLWSNYISFERSFVTAGDPESGLGAFLLLFVFFIGFLITANLTFLFAAKPPFTLAEGMIATGAAIIIWIGCTFIAHDFIAQQIAVEYGTNLALEDLQKYIPSGWEDIDDMQTGTISDDLHADVVVPVVAVSDKNKQAVLVLISQNGTDNYVALFNSHMQSSTLKKIDVGIPGDQLGVEVTVENPFPAPVGEHDLVFEVTFVNRRISGTPALYLDTADLDYQDAAGHYHRAYITLDDAAKNISFTDFDTTAFLRKYVH
jgi:hypothetical protein